MTSRRLRPASDFSIRSVKSPDVNTYITNALDTIANKIEEAVAEHRDYINYELESVFPITTKDYNPADIRLIVYNSVLEELINKGYNVKIIHRKEENFDRIIYVVSWKSIFDKELRKNMIQNLMSHGYD